MAIPSIIICRYDLYVNGCFVYIYIYTHVCYKWWNGNAGGGGRNVRVMGSFQTGFGGVGTATAFASAATFPHYAIQQGIPYNLYGYHSLLLFF